MMSHRTESAVNAQTIFLDGDSKSALSTRFTVDDEAGNWIEAPRPVRAVGVEADDDGPPSDDEQPANAPASNSAASLGMIAIVSGSLWAPGNAGDAPRATRRNRDPDGRTNGPGQNQPGRERPKRQRRTGGRTATAP